MIPKNKPVHLPPKKKAALRQQIMDRDKRCIYCWRGSQLVWHHEPPGNGRRSDEIEKGVVLCLNCHTRRHGKDGTPIKQHCEWYLEALYCWARDSELCINCENPLCECKKESPVKG